MYPSENYSLRNKMCTGKLEGMTCTITSGENVSACSP